MISPDYVAQQFRGVWRMAFGGGDWRADIDSTTDGVFRSFWAIALSAPLAVIAFLAARETLTETPEIQETILVKAPVLVLLASEIVALVLYWTANIGALVITASSINASRQAANVIVAFNWSRLIAFALVAAPAAILGLTGNVSLFVLLYLPALFLSLAILWGVLRACLPINIVMTVSLIAMLVLIEIIIDTLVTYGAIGLYQLLT